MEKLEFTVNIETNIFLIDICLYLREILMNQNFCEVVV